MFCHRGCLICQKESTPEPVKKTLGDNWSRWQNYLMNHINQTINNMTKRCRNTKTHERNLMLFANYLRILKSNKEKYGEQAKGIKASDRYEEASRPFNISSHEAGRIICHMMRQRDITTNTIADIEINEQLEELHFILGNKPLNDFASDIDEIFTRSIEQIKERAKQFVIELKANPV